jgi:hypothetical protein
MYFLSTPTIEFTRTIYIVWAGGNDLVFNSSASITGIVNSFMNGIEDLLAGGTKNIFVFNQPPVQAFPYIKVDSIKQNILRQLQLQLMMEL